MPRWTEPRSTAVVRPAANLMRVTMLVPFWEKNCRARHQNERGQDCGQYSLRTTIAVSGNSLAYRFGLACVAGIPFIGIGNFPSAPLVSAMNAWSPRMESNTTSTRASIISFSRTA
jgi:hypothetical protein